MACAPLTVPLQLQLAQGSTLLLKTESGQFQLLRMGTTPAGQPGAAGVQHALTNATGLVTTGAAGNQTIRLQTMPAVSRLATTGACQLQLRKGPDRQQVNDAIFPK